MEKPHSDVTGLFQADEVVTSTDLPRWVSSKPLHRSENSIVYTLWLFNIAMENGPCLDGLPIKNDDFPWLC